MVRVRPPRSSQTPFATCSGAAHPSLRRRGRERIGAGRAAVEALMARQLPLIARAVPPGKFRVPVGGITDAREGPSEGVCTPMSAHQPTIEPGDLPSTRQIANKLASVAFLLAVGAVLVTQLPGLEHLGDQLAGADFGWITAALILELASTASFALAFHGVYDRRPSARASTSVSLAVQGMNIVLPSGGAGGLAVGAVLLDRAGVPRSFAASRTVALFLVTSLVSFVAVVIAGFGVASGLLAGEAKLALTLLPGALALLVIVGVFALSRSRGPVS